MNTQHFCHALNFCCFFLFFSWCWLLVLCSGSWYFTLIPDRLETRYRDDHFKLSYSQYYSYTAIISDRTHLTEYYEVLNFLKQISHQYWINISILFSFAKKHRVSYKILFHKLIYHICRSYKADYITLFLFNKDISVHLRRVFRYQYIFRAKDWNSIIIIHMHGYLIYQYKIGICEWKFINWTN